ncbi:hypothetical protein LDENG_00236380 [Lucifuga dentata]|nr:hypothetical protein LDENG_00236380 [Lucifuga dentata]
MNEDDDDDDDDDDDVCGSLQALTLNSTAFKMSVNLIPGSEPHASDASPKSTAVGDSKPLHRFIRGQPKITGIIVLILGSSFFIFAIVTRKVYDFDSIWTGIPSGFWLGTLFIICGIQYILTEYKPTKKTVTISLALTIVALLGSIWTLSYLLPHIIHYRGEAMYSSSAENITETDFSDWTPHYLFMPLALDAVYMFYVFMSAVIFIVMSILAGSAVRSTKSQAILVMSTTQTE